MTTPRRPDVISHRGLCRAERTAGRFGENTIEAMVEGVEALRRLGLPPAVEFDVRATSDQKLVVMHDDTLDRTTNGSGRVVEHTLAAITKFDAGDGRRVPQLSEVLAKFKGQKDVMFHVEIKQRGIAGPVADAIKTAGVADRCVVSAFTSEDDWDEGHGRATQGWDELAAFQPSVRIALLCTKERLEAQGTDWLLEEAALRKASAIHIESTATTPTLVAAARARKLEINVFTVNDPDEYLRLAGLGVDGVFCDNPAFVLNFQTSVLPDELAFIERSRLLRKTEDRLDPATAASRPTVGMAFSGGGIRSATFNLGVLQGMAQLGLLSKVDYLSTVSGGGYIGTWLTAWIRRKGVEAVEAGLRNDQFAQNGGAEVQEIRALREFSNYLTPRVGFTSGDTWAFAGAYVRNLLLNQIIIALALSALLLLPRLLTYYSAQMARATPAHGTPSWWALGVGIGLALLALTVTLLNLSSQGRPTGSKRGRVRLATPMLVDLLVVIPILASVWLLWSWWWAVETRGIGWTWELLIGGAGFGVVWAVSWFASEVIRAWDNDAEGQSQLAQAAKDYSMPFLSLAGWAVVAGVIGAVLADGAWRILQDPWLQQRVPEGRLVCWGMPLAMGVLLVVETLHVGLVGRGFTEDAREWWGRLGGQLAFATIGLTAVSAIAIEGPWVIEHFSRFRIGSVLGAGWAGITSAALVLSRRPPAKPDETPGRISRLVFSVAPPIFVGGLLLAASVVIDLGLPALMERLERSGHVHAIAASFLESTRWSTHPHWSDFAETLDWTLWLLVIAGFAAAFVLSWRSGINRFSTNALYRNRLVRCYLGASNRRRPQPFTGMDPSDDSIAFDDLAAPAAPGGQPAYDGPYPIINTTLNLVDTQNLAWQQRKGASFTFTPLHTGYEVQTKDRGPLFAFRRSDLFRRRLKLGLAMAISGAAASPNMGEQSSGALSALLTVFNVRLGWWLANPRFFPGDPWGLGPKVGLFYLFFELMGRTNQDNDYVYLSDGGHFENLGVYELVRRRCRYIVISDAGEDHAIAFADLGNAIEKCRTDFGVDIEIDIEPLRPKGDPKLSQWHCAVGVIHYELVNPAWPPGIVAYIKATMTGDEPTDVQRYAAQETAFPHQSTANQWFTESQFESYRALGRHIVLESAGVLGDRDSLSQLRAEEFFVKLKEHWYPPSRFVQAAFTKHTATYTALLEKLRAQPDLLGFLDPQVYPEWTDLMADHQSKDGGWSIALDLPADPKQRRAGFYLCNEVIQLIEDAYIDLNLEAEFEHPDNRGWMNLLKHWSWSGMFRATWAISASIYGARFQRFCERRLDLKPGIVALRNELLGRDEMRKADVGFWGGVKNSHGIDFWEAQLIQVFLTVGAGHALDLGRVRIVPFAMDIGRLPAGKAALTFNVGFAVMAGDALVYFRIQDHVRKMGLGRAALRALMKAQPRLQYGVEFAQMPPDGVPTPAGSAPDDAFPSAAALQQFKNLFESVRAEIGARARA